MSEPQGVRSQEYRHARCATHDLARDPQDLERLLVIRQHAGDIEGMMVLYEPQAVVDCGDGRVLRGTDAIRAYPRVRPPAGSRTSFAGTVTAGRKFAVGEQRVLGLDPGTVINGELALTSTRLCPTAPSPPGACPGLDPGACPGLDPGSPAAGPTAPGAGSSTSSSTPSVPAPARQIRSIVASRCWLKPGAR